MKTICAIFFALMATAAAAESSFSGKVDAFQQEGERIVIDGKDYRVTGETQVIVGEHSVGREAIQVGQTIRYTPDFSQPGGSFIKRIELQLSAEKAAVLFNH